jgi:nitrogen fixation/metabolism regulation signal transduction histidine kinase
MLISTGLVLILNMMVYLYANERLSVVSTEPVFDGAYSTTRRMLVVALSIETALFTVAFALLGKFTAHRIAGPYIRLRQVCTSVGEGDFQQALRFRNYDHLEEVEDAFNKMMARVRAELGARTEETNDA